MKLILIAGLFGGVVQSDQGTHHQQGHLLRELWDGAAPGGQSRFSDR